MVKKQLFATTLLLLLGAIWGSGYTIARYATTHGVPPLGYAFWQSLGPSLFLLIANFTLNKRIPVTGHFIFFYIISGLIGIAIPNSVMYFVAPHLPSGIVAVLVNTVPIITYTLTLILGQERLSVMRLFGVIVGFLGILIIVFPNISFPAFSALPQIFILLITPFCFAICAIFATHFSSQKYNAMLLAAGMLSAATIMITPVVLLTNNFYFFHWPFNFQDWLIILEIFLSSVGYVLFFLLLKNAGPVYYSMVGGIVMLTGLFWGWLVFNEKLNHWTSIAALLILFGVGLVTLGQHARSEINKSRS